MFKPTRLFPLLLCLCLVLFTAPAAGQEDAPPYSYYYSPERNVFVVERADRTDRHQFGRGVYQERSELMAGSGWSANGQWFEAFSPTQQPGTRLFRPDRRARVHSLEMMTYANVISWSPDFNYILAAGRSYSCYSNCSTTNMWLIDVQQDSILAWFDLSNERPDIPVALPPAEWSSNGDVTFYATGNRLGSPSTIELGNYRIRMFTDGTVEKTRLSEETWNAIAAPIYFDAPSSDIHNLEFTSPDGHYSIVTTETEAATLINNDTGERITVPQAQFDIEDAEYLVDVQWHPSGGWALLSYYNEIWPANATSIFRLDGSYYRQLTRCGTSQGCVGWLPDNVDVSSLEPLDTE